MVPRQFSFSNRIGALVTYSGCDGSHTLVCESPLRYDASCCVQKPNYIRSKVLCTSMHIYAPIIPENMLENIHSHRIHVWYIYLHEWLIFMVFM